MVIIQHHSIFKNASRSINSVCQYFQICRWSYDSRYKIPEADSIELHCFPLEVPLSVHSQHILAVTETTSILNVHTASWISPSHPRTNRDFRPYVFKVSLSQLMDDALWSLTLIGLICSFPQKQSVCVWLSLSLCKLPHPPGLCALSLLDHTHFINKHIKGRSLNEVNRLCEDASTKRRSIWGNQTL